MISKSLRFGSLRVEDPTPPKDIRTKFEFVLLIWETDFYIQCPYWEELRSLYEVFQTGAPVLDKNHAPRGPEILSSTGAGAWRKAPMAFPDSSSVLDKFQSARWSVLCFLRFSLPKVL